MHFQNFLAADDVRIRHHDLTVETTRPQKCGIKNVRTVGRGNDDDAFRGFKPVHFDKQLIERLFTLIIAAAKTGAAMTTDSVDFVDEDDARCILLGLFEHVADTACANTDEHFHEIRAGDCEERNACLACNSTGNQGFAGSRRSDE